MCLLVGLELRLEADMMMSLVRKLFPLSSWIIFRRIKVKSTCLFVKRFPVVVECERPVIGRIILPGGTLIIS